MKWSLLGSAPPTVFRGWRSKYKAASRRIKEGLTDKKYKDVAKVATRMAFVVTPPKYSFSAILAGVQAYQMGKEQKWRPSSDELAKAGIKKAEQITEYRLRPQQVKSIKRLIQASLDKVKKEMEETS